MARQARKKSSTHIYHIMLRGINQQQIFEDKEDYEKFIQIITDCKELSGFSLLAYCLMGNHVHLLIKENNESIEQIFKRIGSRYVYWFNVKYKRVGHLFQDRFKSEPVETDKYLLTVIRYIHQNPVKAGICRSVDAYPYSSFQCFVQQVKLVDFDLVFSILSKDQFIDFNQSVSNDVCLDVADSLSVRVTDEQAKKIIFKVSKCKNSSDFQRFDPITRDKFLTLFRKNGLSIRQICRLTGISYNIVRKF